MKRGKFIVIEGTDGSGKTTQFELLLKRLKKNGNKVSAVDFPRYYDSKWGEMVGNFLRGEYGDFDSTSPYLVALLYMLDQYTWGRDFGRKIMEKGKIILSNRYFTSNAHQIAKLKGKAQEKFREWLWPMGYDQLNILKPDLVLFLDVKPKIAFSLNKTKKDRKYLKGKSEDEAEKRYYHQKDAYKEYLKSAKQFKYWKVIKCMSGERIDSTEVIHDRIWKVVKKFI